MFLVILIGMMLRSNYLGVTSVIRESSIDYMPVQKGVRGALCKVSKKVKVWQLFTERADKFTTAKISLYGEEKELQYFCIDLLWELRLYRELRFGLVPGSLLKTLRTQGFS